MSGRRRKHAPPSWASPLRRASAFDTSPRLRAGTGLDLLLLEQTFGDRTDLPGDHLTLGAFARTVDALRRVGAVTDRTDVVAVHLSHFNPPGAELAHRLAACGARRSGGCPGSRAAA